ncbi:MAG: ComF family protein [Acidimicrobiia bacterium]
MELLRRGCVVCGAGRVALCAACLRRTSPPPSTRVRDVGPVEALFAYEGHGARIVQALKYRDGRRLVGPLADALAARCDARPPLVVTWVPTSASRRRHRGFDQSELLARAVGRRLGARVSPVLRRRPGPAQTGLDRVARSQAAGYVATTRPGAPVVLVDDVCTTGATLRAATAAVAQAGGDVVTHLVVARTP